MPKVCLYFQVHQPIRVKRYRFFDIGRDENYFNDQSENTLNNQKILEKVSQKSYLPVNNLLLGLLNKCPGFKVAFSFSGIFLEQCERYMPEVITSFKKLIDTSKVEILSETYYHSLAFILSKPEFRRQIQLHKRKIRQLFGYTPKVMRNTELIYNNEVGYEAEGLGFKAVLSEGADHILGWRSPNFLYTPKGAKKIKLLLKNYHLSDDVAFRFSSKGWNEYPLNAPKYASWISDINGNGDIVNLFMDYETFGEHQWEDTGIFEFLRQLPYEILKHHGNSFVTPTEAADQLVPIAELDIPDFISWADTERDLSAWLSNPMQYDALQKIFSLEKVLMDLNDSKLLDDWRKLTTSDHFYYMCTKWFSDGDVHKYFNPYESPYEAFICYMNVLNDLKLRIEHKKATLKQEKEKILKSIRTKKYA